MIIIDGKGPTKNFVISPVAPVANTENGYLYKLSIDESGGQNLFLQEVTTIPESILYVFSASNTSEMDSVAAVSGHDVSVCEFSRSLVN